MTISDTTTVDGLGIDRLNGDRLIMVVSDHLLWGDLSGHLLQLAQKLEAYVDFTKSGQQLTTHPESAGMSVMIRVLMLHPPPSDVTPLFDNLRNQLSELANIGLQFEQIPDDAALDQ